MSVTGHSSCYGRGKSLQRQNHIHSLIMFCLSYSQARERLPGANEEIEEVTPELRESVTVVSQQLVTATDHHTRNTGLLPLDLEATNNIVEQVSSHLILF